MSLKTPPVMFRLQTRSEKLFHVFGLAVEKVCRLYVLVRETNRLQSMKSRYLQDVCGGVAEWLEHLSLAGRLSMIFA